MKEILEFKTFSTKEETCKWINQYRKLIDVISIIYDSTKQEFIVFHYWK